jgi:hypothetical protein
MQHEMANMKSTSIATAKPSSFMAGLGLRSKSMNTIVGELEDGQGNGSGEPTMVGEG